MIKQKYVVTARNRLTGQRDTISLECSRPTAEKLRQKMLKSKAGARDYLYPKVVPSYHQTELNFKNNE